MLIAVHSPSVCPAGWSTGWSGSSLLISLAVALGVSVVVTSAQAIVICKRRNCGHCGGELVFIKVIENISTFCAQFKYVHSFLRLPISTVVPFPKMIFPQAATAQ